MISSISINCEVYHTQMNLLISKQHAASTQDQYDLGSVAKPKLSLKYTPTVAEVKCLRSEGALPSPILLKMSMWRGKDSW